MCKSILKLVAVLGMLSTSNVHAQFGGFTHCDRLCQTQSSNYYRCNAYCKCVHKDRKGNLYCTIRSTIDHPNVLQNQQTTTSGSGNNLSTQPGTALR